MSFPFGPLVELLKKRVSDDELVAQGGALAQLVFGKAADLHSEFTHALRALAFFHDFHGHGFQDMVSCHGRCQWR